MDSLGRRVYASNCTCLSLLPRIYCKVPRQDADKTTEMQHEEMRPNKLSGMTVESHLCICHDVATHIVDVFCEAEQLFEKRVVFLMVVNNK